jgi:hypothetical protein
MLLHRLSSSGWWALNARATALDDDGPVSGDEDPDESVE